MSLADELLADFESIDESQRNVDENQHENQMEIDENNENHSKEISTEKNRKIFSSNRIDQIAKLRYSSLFIETMEKIDYYRTHQRISQLEIEGVVEHDPEYLLIVDANKILVEIDNEIDLIHNFVKTIYRQRFPELEQLIQIPLDYLRTVQVRRISSVVSFRLIDRLTFVFSFQRNCRIMSKKLKQTNIYRRFFLRQPL